jgi:phage terminase large subunit GpA-like protein
MKHLKMAVLALSMAPLATVSLPVPTAQAASTIERACVKSDRRAASKPLCGCIQDAANMTLSRSDQKRAAKFFKEPHEAQVIRQSDRSSDEKFWLRYKEFGKTARTFCTG